MKILNTEYSLEDIFKQKTTLNKFLDYPGYLIYKIRNKLNNKIYIGDTFKSIRDRFIKNSISHLNQVKKFNPKHLYNSINKYGSSNFLVEIISIKKTDTESTFISFYDSYYNGYNGNTSGIHSKSRKKNPGLNIPKSTRIFITKKKKRKFIKPNTLSYYLNLGWSKSKYNTPKVRINKYGKERLIIKSDLHTYLGLGWNKGSFYRGALGKVRINNGKVSKLIKKDEVPIYLSKGWKKGRLTYNNPTLDTIWINNGKESKMIPKKSKIPEGYKLGRGSRWMNNGVLCNNVNIGDLASFESKGWRYGRI